MADQIYVTVENVQNPAVKRKMTLVSAQINYRKWKIVGDYATVEAPKKKDAAKPVASVEKIIPVTQPILAPESEFANISEQTDDESEEIEQLRAQYQEKAGKPADKRWKADKLNAKLAEL